MVHLENPWFLLLLIFLPLFAFLKWSGNRKSEGSIKISSVVFISSGMRSRGLLRYRIIIIMQFLVLALIIFGLARPQLVGNIQESKVEVIDLMMVLDISSSMLADDFQPNRFIGFVRTPCSYHSVPPRCLPQNITRDCFQINIWNLRSRVK